MSAAYIPYHDINGKVIEDHAVLRIYAPQDVLGDWSEIARDVTKLISFSEGQKKSACPCKYEVPTIGLEGVDNFVQRVKEEASYEQIYGTKILPKLSRRKPRNNALDDFDLFEWITRPVDLAYDADRYFNQNVAGASLRLGALLMKKGARPALVDFQCECRPPCKGIDDFIVKHGIDAYLKLPRRSLNQLDLVVARFVKLASPPASVYDRELHQLMPAHKFTVNASHYKVLTVSAKGIPIEIPAAGEWLEDTQAASRLLFDPALKAEDYLEDPKFPDHRGFNCYRDQFPNPRKGDIGPYLELIQRLFADPAERKLFEQWCAKSHQRPGAKINFAIVMVGKKGIGKTLLGQAVGATYGEYLRHIKQPKAVHEKFNSLFENKLMVLADEVVRNQVEADNLKSHITADTIEIEHKGLAKYDGDFRANFYFTTNHQDALNIDSDDRRWWIVGCPNWGTPKLLRIARALCELRAPTMCHPWTEAARPGHRPEERRRIVRRI